jgi:hypothetical protein
MSQMLEDLEDLEMIALGHPGNEKRLLSDMYARYSHAAGPKREEEHPSLTACGIKSNNCLTLSKFGITANNTGEVGKGIVSWELEAAGFARRNPIGLLHRSASVPAVYARVSQKRAR